MQDYWKKQEAGKLLFPDIEWNKPEQKSLAGKLLIIGGSTSGFIGIKNLKRAGKNAVYRGDIELVPAAPFCGK